jgi:acyl-CoA synthetase (AMP-forming)/AMP-acid ligase II
MMDRGIGSWIERRAEIGPNRPAIISGSATYTYAELANRVRRLANGLRNLGVQRGDRVAWLGPNHAAFLELLFATGKLGAVLSPVNHRLDSSVVAYVLEDSSPSIAVVEASMANMPLPSPIQTRIVVGDPDGRMLGYEHLLDDSTDDPIAEEVGLDDLCMVPYTSGTTGPPKGVMLTHGNVTWNVVNFLSSADFLANDVTIAIAPFFRVGGTGVNVLPVLFKGGTVVVPDRFDPDEILRLMERHRVTVGFGNPDLLDALTHSSSWPSVGLTSVRFFLSGGAPVPERLIHTYFERGITFIQGYGLSEAGPLALLLDQQSALGKAGSAGKPPLFVDVRIVDGEGADCATGETGELLVRGPNVMAGYWNSPEETSKALSEDGWLRTGDAARRDQDGYIWIVDRMNDAYVSSGRTVYPGDIERVLTEHPAVTEAGVAGAPTAEGSVGKAFVVPSKAQRANESALLEFCRERLAPAEVPGSITFVESLPRNSVGKLLRQDLLALAEVGASAGKRKR